MKFPRLQQLAATCLAVLAGLQTVHAADRLEAPHIEVSLVAELSGVEPGTTTSIGILLNPQAGWHTYWQNPGDTGLPTRVNWTLPRGAEMGELQWPLPERAAYQDLTNYGYQGPALLIADLSVPANYSGSSLAIAAEVDWLVCEEVCIPGSGSLDLSLPVVANATPSADAGLFASARLRHPQPLAFDSATFEFGSEAVIRVQGVDAALLGMGPFEFFPMQPGYADNAATPRIIRTLDGLLIQTGLRESGLRVPERLEALLVYETADGPRAVQFSAQPDPAMVGVANPAAQLSLAVLAFALLGGLILNLMPCVFPILSLKALSIVESSHYTAAQRRGHGLAYTAGVLACFLLVAGLLLGLRAAGQEIGWGFQLQSPVFVAVLAYLLFVLGLSLSGFIELGTSLMRVGNLAYDSTKAGGSFLTGALAVVVATPCTAPFMGTAMGVAVTLPAGLALLVFAVLGLGMALPILLVSFVPAIAHWFPKPGAWMVTFKEFLAFPLYLTVIWLLWVLTRQTDASSLALVMIGMVSLAFGLWLWKGAFHARRPWWRRGLALVAALMALALLPMPHNVEQDSLLEAQPWSAAALATARSSGKPIFVNFTADWCITCKVNERVVLETQSTAELFAEHEVIYLKADWTNADDVITRELAKFGRSGVPLYLAYRPGQSEPEILPQILTLGALRDALTDESL